MQTRTRTRTRIGLRAAGGSVLFQKHRAIRLTQLAAGLLLFGISLALMVRADLGLTTWDALHQGISRHTGLQIGWVVTGVGAIVLIAWIPLHQRPGLGTLANVLVVGPVANAALDLLPIEHAMVLRVSSLAAGILGIGLASGLYIGAGFGPGPRDGLMMGLAQRGLSLPVARTLIELTVLGIGFSLGGTVGIGTLAYVLSIGPLAGFLVPRLTREKGLPQTVSTSALVARRNRDLGDRPLRPRTTWWIDFRSRAITSSSTTTAAATHPTCRH